MRQTAADSFSPGGRQRSRASWITVLIVIGVVLGIYFGWPRLVTYWENLSLKQAIRANSVSCLDPTVAEEGCKAKMLKVAREEIGLDLTSDELQININPATRKIVVEVAYKARLRYLLTGSMFGMKKDQFVQYRYRVITESKYTL
jgi:hypothetical protein